MAYSHLPWPNAFDRTKEANKLLEKYWFEANSTRKVRPHVNKYMLVGDRVEEVREVIVHSFAMGDVEDPDLYAAQPLNEWQESEAGQWVMTNSIDVPQWHRMADPGSFGYKYYITAKLRGAALTEYLLRHPV